MHCGKGGRSSYRKTPYYDNNGIFYSYSKEEFNREYCALYIYFITEEELHGMETGLNIEPVSFEGLVKGIDTDYSNFGSSILQLLYSPENRQIVLERVYERFKNMFEDLIKNPVPIKKEYLDSVFERLKEIVELRDWKSPDERMKKEEDLRKEDPDYLERRRNNALQKLEGIYNNCIALTTWQNLKKFCKSEMGTRELLEAIRLMKEYGDDAGSIEGRALLYVLLSQEVNLVLENNVTISGILKLYNKLPEDIKQALARSGITVEVIERSTVVNTDGRFNPDEFKQDAITEMAA